MPRIGELADDASYGYSDLGIPIGGAPEYDRAPGQRQWSDIVNKLPAAVMGGVAQMVETPGALMKANPYPPGTEQADAYEAFKKSTATEWAPGMAINTIGASMPFAQRGALGSGGGAMTQPQMGDVLGLKGMTISRGPPRGMLAAEEFTAPAGPVPLAPERPNTFADPKLRAKAEKIWDSYPQYAEAYPEVGPPALKEKAPDPKNPGKFLIAPKKGEIPYASMEEALARAEEPNYFLEKKLTPEAAQFQKQRNIVQQDMDLHGYNKYFDPAKRADIPSSDYGPFVDTGTAASPKKAAVDAEWTKKYGTDEARARLQEGYEKGQSLGNAENWYYMKQLQDKYVEVLGEQAGKEAFKKEFSGMMAATTGGASPYNNWLMSHYAGYLNKLGQRVDQRAYEMPFPIGGRFASGNMEQAQKYIDSGMKGFDPAKNPKRYDFDNALAGDRNAGVIDEQMSGAFIPGMTIPDWYGPATRILREEAAKAGTDPRAFQDVGWAGLKALKTEAEAAAKAAKRAKPGVGHNSEPFQFQYEGPMIDQINRSIETTHRLTGMPIEEIVTRGVIKKEIPMYGLGALGLTGPMMGALADQSKYQTEEKM